jgi:hypothetical protein
MSQCATSTRRLCHSGRPAWWTEPAALQSLLDLPHVEPQCTLRSVANANSTELGRMFTDPVDAHADVTRDRRSIDVPAHGELALLAKELRDPARDSLLIHPGSPCPPAR